MRAHLYSTFPWLAILACSCTSMDLSPDLNENRCTTAHKLTVSTTPAQLAASSEEVVVHGTASSTDGVAIRGVMVEGVDAVQSSFNFGSWAATIAADQVRARLPAKATTDTMVMLDVVAHDACSTINDTEKAPVLVKMP